MMKKLAALCVVLALCAIGYVIYEKTRPPLDWRYYADCSKMLYSHRMFTYIKTDEVEQHKLAVAEAQQVFGETITKQFIDKVAGERSKFWQFMERHGFSEALTQTSDETDIEGGDPPASVRIRFGFFESSLGQFETAELQKLTVPSERNNDWNNQTSPWSNIAYHNGACYIIATLIWNDRQFLADQLNLEEGHVVLDGWVIGDEKWLANLRAMPQRLAQLMRETDADWAQLDVNARRKLWPPVKQKLLQQYEPDIVWLAGLMSRSLKNPVDELSSLDAVLFLNKAIEQNTPKHVGMVMQMVDRFIPVVKQGSMMLNARFTNILELKNMVDLNTLKLDHLDPSPTPPN
jgi:hypothetical protein